MARIERIVEISQIPHLAQIAHREGFVFLHRLLTEWQEGTNRFEAPGEILYGAFVGETLIATAGLTSQAPGLGRVRRVYVHPDHRQQGIAGSLILELLAFARLHYTQLILFTETPEAHRLYERLGFIPEDPNGPNHATHRLNLVGLDLRQNSKAPTDRATS